MILTDLDVGHTIRDASVWNSKQVVPQQHGQMGAVVRFTERLILLKVAERLREKAEGLREAHPADECGMQDADTHGGIVRLREAADAIEAEIGVGG